MTCNDRNLIQDFEKYEYETQMEYILSKEFFGELATQQF